jgi:hypothetical protein
MTPPGARVQCIDTATNRDLQVEVAKALNEARRLRRHIRRLLAALKCDTGEAR